MKIYTYILIVICIEQTCICQSNFGIKDFVNNSDQIFLLEVVKIDTLEPIKKYSMFVYSGNLEYNLVESYKSDVINDSIPIVYQITEYSHMHKAEPNVGEKYIAFTVYDSSLNAYTLPEHRYSLAKISNSNIESARNIINYIIENPEPNECEYFNLISSNFNEVILPINKDLNTLSNFTNNLDSLYCIDRNKKNEIYNDYIESRNIRLLPFVREFKQAEIDRILIEELQKHLSVIKETSERYWIEDASIVLTNISNLSYIYNNKKAKLEVDKIASEYISNFDKIFVNQVKDVLKKYDNSH